MHELAKEFPNKTYRELEIYRNADRQEEAQRIFTQHDNEELKEDQVEENLFFKEEEEKTWDDIAKMFGAKSNMQLLAQKRHIDVNWIAGTVELVDELPRREDLTLSGFNAEE